MHFNSGWGSTGIGCYTVLTLSGAAVVAAVVAAVAAVDAAVVAGASVVVVGASVVVVGAAVVDAASVVGSCHITGIKYTKLK